MRSSRFNTAVFAFAGKKGEDSFTDIVFMMPCDHRKCRADTGEPEVTIAPLWDILMLLFSSTILLFWDLPLRTATYVRPTLSLS